MSALILCDFCCVFAGQLISDFTPANSITAFEILPGGEFVVVASSGTPYPTVLQLRGPQRTTATVEQKMYGDEAMLEVDLSSDFRDDALAVSAGAR